MARLFAIWTTAKWRTVDYPAWGLFVSFCVLAPVRFATKEFAACQNAFTFRQMDSALATAHHIFGRFRNVLFGRLPEVRLKQPVNNGTNGKQKNQATHVNTLPYSSCVL
jgi:hypothetical protein